MKSRLGSFLGLVVTLTVVGSAVAFWILYVTSQKKAEAPKPVPPATQTKAVKESDLNILTLTPEAETRLAVKTQKLATKKIDRVRSLGGEVMLPAGRTLTVSAPFVGTLKAVRVDRGTGTAPGAASAGIAPGQIVKKGQGIFTLVPLLTNEARTSLATSLVEVEGQVSSAEVQLGATMKALARAKQLLEEGAGSKKAVDEAQAAFELAQKGSEAALARRDLLVKTIRGVDSGSVVSLAIEAPGNGMVRAVFVAPEQAVSAGAPLFEVVNHDAMWVRVPVYVGDLGDLAADRSAALGRVGEPAGNLTMSIKPIAAPPSATVASATVDLYYEIDNKAGGWAPGQRVAVALPLRYEEESLVVPWSAVVHDVNGGAWVYENVSPQNYVRRRVQVQRVVDAEAVLSSGPPVGTAVVTQGVAEIFGKEMGFGK